MPTASPIPHPLANTFSAYFHASIASFLYFLFDSSRWSPQNKGMAPTIFSGSPAKYAWAAQMRQSPSPAERGFITALKDFQPALNWQHQVVILGWIVDFFFPTHNLVVEIDGRQHEENKEYDQRRDNVLRSNGLIVLRIQASPMFDKKLRAAILRNIAAQYLGVRCKSQPQRQTHRRKRQWSLNQTDRVKEQQNYQRLLERGRL